MNGFFYFFVFTATLAACSKIDDRNKMNEHNFSEPRTHCIGRHVVQIPGDFALTAGTSGIFLPKNVGEEFPPIEISVGKSGLSSSQFDDELRRRRSEILKLSDATTDILRAEKQLSPTATLFRVQRIKESYTSEVHLLKGDSLITASLKSYDGTFAVAEAMLLLFVANIQEGDTTMAPTQGFCLGPVFLNGDYEDESASFVFRNTNDPGSYFGIEIKTFKPDEKVSLLQRMSGPDSLLAQFDAEHKVLRKGELTVAGMRAEEWLGSIELGKNQDQKQFGFALETRRAMPGRKAPSIRVSFDTGQADENGDVRAAALSDDDAVKLWDSVVSTIRLNQQR